MLDDVAGLHKDDLEEPEPGSALLLVLGAVAVFGRAAVEDVFGGRVTKSSNITLQSAANKRH